MVIKLTLLNGNSFLVNTNQVQTIFPKFYKGNYVTNSSVSYGNVQNFGKNYSYGTSQIYNSGNSGRAILFSSNGDKLSCEFTYDDNTAIGVCSNSKGEKFDLISKSLVEKN